MSHRSPSHADVSANKSRFVKLRFKLLFGLRPLKNSLENGRDLDDLMWIFKRLGCNATIEIWVKSRNAGVLFLSYQILSVLVVGRYTNEGVLVIMTGRSTRSNTANKTKPPNEIADEVTQQLNTALPNMLTQLVQALGGNQTNQREVTQSCSIKTFRASGAKEFFGTEGAVGLLTWFESIESVLHITKCP
ncbi:hypothetical protein Tco_1292735 [Tanacetum coccineum]